MSGATKNQSGIGALQMFLIIMGSVLIVAALVIVILLSNTKDEPAPVISEATKQSGAIEKLEKTLSVLPANADESVQAKYTGEPEIPIRLSAPDATVRIPADFSLLLASSSDDENPLSVYEADKLLRGQGMVQRAEVGSDKKLPHALFYVGEYAACTLEDRADSGAVSCVSIDTYKESVKQVASAFDALKFEFRQAAPTDLSNMKYIVSSDKKALGLYANNLLGVGQPTIYMANTGDSWKYIGGENDHEALCSEIAGNTYDDVFEEIITNCPEPEPGSNVDQPEA